MQWIGNRWLVQKFQHLSVNKLSLRVHRNPEKFIAFFSSYIFLAFRGVELACDLLAPFDQRSFNQVLLAYFLLAEAEALEELTTVRNPSNVPNLAKEDATLLMNRIHDRLPCFHLLFSPNPRRVWIPWPNNYSISMNKHKITIHINSYKSTQFGTLRI